jgi:predicted PurR-regulated permease PerM
VITNMQLVWWLFTRVYSVFNYFISLLLFLTALFYLLTLSSAHGNYEPYNKILFMFEGAPHVNIENHIRRAIEQVFESSLKIALFHGMWCWLTYTVFGCSLTYTTSLTMASVAVTALIGTYWLSLPAVLQLWLYSNRPIHALVLFLLHLGATWFVDPVIYGQIQGSHHYVTGLSVVGGLYFLGLEGVIIGPMLLCAILIFAQVFRDYAVGNGYASGGDVDDDDDDDGEANGDGDNNNNNNNNKRGKGGDGSRGSGERARREPATPIVSKAQQYKNRRADGFRGDEQQQQQQQQVDDDDDEHYRQRRRHG